MTPEPENETTARKIGRTTRNKAAADAPPMQGQTSWTNTGHAPAEKVADNGFPDPDRIRDNSNADGAPKSGLEPCGVCGRTLRNHPGNEPCKPPELSNAGAKPAKARKTRSYASQLEALQSRVDTAIRLLTRSLANAEGTPRELVQVAIETLQGDA